MNFDIILLPGDGIGPEVTDAAAVVLNAVEQKFGHNFNMHVMPIGGSAIDDTGVPLPKETLDACKQANAVLLGAVGGPKWDGLKPHMRPERGLLALRSGLNLFAALSPVVTYEALAQTGILKPSTAKAGVNIMLVREISGGMFFGEHGFRDGALGQEAFDNEVYSISEVERIAKIAFEIAGSRRGTVTSVDRADILTTGKLWKATTDRVAKGYPDVTLEHSLINKCILRILSAPGTLDVVLTSNLFGSMLSAVMAALPGSIGMIPSESVGGAVRLYEPIHGSAPDIAGRDEANPIGAILSAAMLLSGSLGLEKEAAAVDRAVRATLDKGLRTKDVAGGKKYVSCSRMAEEISLNLLYSK